MIRFSGVIRTTDSGCVFIDNLYKVLNQILANGEFTKGILGHSLESFREFGNL